MVIEGAKIDFLRNHQLSNIEIRLQRAILGWRLKAGSGKSVLA